MQSALYLFKREVDKLVTAYATTPWCILHLYVPMPAILRIRNARRVRDEVESYLLGLLAKIKCSICSYQLNLWYVTHGVTRV